MQFRLGFLLILFFGSLQGGSLGWAIFGNDDSGVYGENEDFESESPNNSKKARHWWLRNPMHNFTFYVIGSANRQNSEWTLLRICPHKTKALTYKKVGSTVFPCKKSCFFLGFHGWKPFISLRLGRVESYLGWRERGNFGIKLRFSRSCHAGRRRSISSKISGRGSAAGSKEEASSLRGAF